MAVDSSHTYRESVGASLNSVEEIYIQVYTATNFQNCMLPIGKTSYCCKPWGEVQA
jgi:hypothetical protein